MQENDLRMMTSTENGRRHQTNKMEDDLKKMKMEDDLQKNENGR